MAFREASNRIFRNNFRISKFQACLRTSPWREVHFGSFDSLKSKKFDRIDEKGFQFFLQMMGLPACRLTFRSGVSQFGREIFSLFSF